MVASVQCTVDIGQPAPAGGSTVTLQASSSRVQVPAQVVIPAGQESASFVVAVVASDQDAQPQITAALSGAVRTASISITGIRPTSLNFANNAPSAGQWVDADVDLNSTNVPEIARLAVASSSADLLVPSSIVTRPGQTHVTFRVYVNPVAKQQSAQVSIQFGQTVVTTPLAVTPLPTPVLNLPGETAVLAGQPVAFTVSAVDPAGLPLVYSAASLPAGASFDANAGSFSWTPSSAQTGTYNVKFEVTNSAQASASGQVRIDVDQGLPVITAVRNAASPKASACSPGALASVVGRWLAPQGSSLSDPAASGTELNGARVQINGDYVPLVHAEWARVDFVCPAVAAGTALSVVAEAAAGSSDPLNVRPTGMAPALFSADGSGGGQGLVYLTGTSLLATSRDYTALGQPAQPGDSISIRVTGLDDSGDSAPIVTIGGLVATVDSIKAVPSMTGVSEITVTVPPGVQPGDSVPVVAAFDVTALPASRASSRESVRVRSNLVTVAIESGQ